MPKKLAAIFAIAIFVVLLVWTRYFTNSTELPENSSAEKPEAKSYEQAVSYSKPESSSRSTTTSAGDTAAIALRPEGTLLVYPDSSSTEYLQAFRKAETFFEPDQSVVRFRVMQSNFDAVYELLREAQSESGAFHFDLPIFDEVGCTIIGTNSVRQRKSEHAWTIVPECRESRYMQIGINPAEKQWSVRYDRGKSLYMVLMMTDNYLATFELDQSE